MIIIPIIETLVLLWIMVGMLLGAIYLDNRNRITKKSKHILFAIFGGPVVWCGWIAWLFLKILSKFEDWLTE